MFFKTYFNSEVKTGTFPIFHMSNNIVKYFLPVHRQIWVDCSQQLLPSVLRMTAMKLLLVGATKNRADCPHYDTDEQNFGAHCVSEST